MRRLALVVAVIGACFPSWAAADPFEQLSSRVERYDEETRTNRPAASTGRTAARPRSDADRRVQPRERLVSHEQDERANWERAALPPGRASRGRPAAYAETVVPEPIPDGEYSEGGPGGGTWEEPFDEGFYDGGCDGCCEDGCGSCGTCGGFCIPRGFWGRAEYLYWWARGSNTPPLVTTSPQGTNILDAGVLPDATVLFGGGRINGGGRNGGRFTFGYWFDDCEELGIENTFLFLGNQADGYSQTSTGNPILARPFFNTETSAQEALVLAYPNRIIGSIQVNSNSQIYGNEVNLRRALANDCCRRVDLLFGYRYFQVNEGLNVTTQTTSVDTSVPVGTISDVFDGFKTRNQFNGGQLGLNWQIYRGCWTFDLLAKVAIGGVNQNVSIDGTTTVTVPGASPVTHDSGILALPSNQGFHQRTRFATLPEFGATVRYQLTPLCKVSLGYSLMFLTNVVRPGDEVDLNLDPRQFPPGVAGTQPAFTWNDTDIWMQGISAGVECNF